MNKLMEVVTARFYAFVLIVFLTGNIYAEAGTLGFTFQVQADTLVQNDSLCVTPYFESSDVKTFGNFGVVRPNKIMFQTYAGFNVLNTLSGQVPNFFGNANSNEMAANGAMLIIDGLPFNSDFANYHNLNSFEYKNVYAFSSGNASTLYGGGSNAAFFLESKTGEDVTRPTVEFNSTTSDTWTETTSLFGESGNSSQMRLTNAIAYSQDFGVVDTRISYNYTYMPDGSSAQDAKQGYHYLRINTGFTITPRLKARIILDDFYTNTKTSVNALFHGQPIVFNSESSKKNLQGNLQLQYQVLNWLKLSSQSSLGKIEDNYSAFGQSGSTSYQSQKREFANLYASTNNSIGSHFGLTSFIGFQYEHLDVEQSGKTVSSIYYSNSENKTTAVLAGVGANFNQYLFANVNYRKDQYSVYGPDHSSEPNYSLNTAFVFSEAFHMTNSWFSFGKLRTSVGKNSVALGQGYPAVIDYSVSSLPNPGLHAGRNNMFELGTDLSFGHERIMINMNYFSDVQKDLAITFPANPAIGYGNVTTNAGEQYVKGWGLVIGVIPLKKYNFTWETKLVWGNYKVEVDIVNTPGNIPPPMPTPIPTPPATETILGSPLPDWTSSWLNQMTYRNFFISCLVEHTQGGSIYSFYFDPNSGGLTGTIQDRTIAKLRDVSLGYRLPALKKVIKEAQLSLSGANLITIYSKSGSNGEVPKSISASLSARF